MLLLSSLNLSHFSIDNFSFKKFLQIKKNIFFAFVILIFIVPPIKAMGQDEDTVELTSPSSKKRKEKPEPQKNTPSKKKKKSEEIINLEANAKKGNSISLLTLGLKYYNGQGINQSKTKAFTNIQKAVKAKNNLAKYCLGILHSNESGNISKDRYKKASYEEALKLFQEFVRQAKKDKQTDFQSTKNISDATFRIANMFDEGKGTDINKAKAADWFYEAVQEGHNQALEKLKNLARDETIKLQKAPYNLGQIYLKGEGTRQDYLEAFDWFKKAAERKSPDAYLPLVKMYQGGHIGEDKYTELFKVLKGKIEEQRNRNRKIEEQRNRDAEYVLGCMCLKGQGTQMNLTEAREFLLKAARKGHEEALQTLEIIEDKEEPIEIRHERSKIYIERKNYLKAGVLLTSLEEKQHFPAYITHGEMYEKGQLDDKPDYVAAYNLYIKAMQKKDSIGAEANLHIGRLFENGYIHLTGTPAEPNYQTAVKYHQVAVSLGNTEASFHIGNIYEKNLTKDQTDNQRALSCYKTAAAKGYKMAQERLITLSSEGKYIPWDKEITNGLIQALLRDSKYRENGYSVFLQETVSEEYLFKLSQLIVMPLDLHKAPAFIKGAQKVVPDLMYGPIYVAEKEQYYPYEDSVLVIDPSGTGSDETAYCVAKKYKEMYFVTALGGFEGGYKTKPNGTSKEVCQKLGDIATGQSVARIVIEKNASQGFSDLLKQICPSLTNKITESSSNISKRTRIINILKPLLRAQGRLVIDTKVLKDDFDSEPQTDITFKFFYQLSSMTQDEKRDFKRDMPHDDRLDALAMAIKCLKERK